ncbi:4'-phosphopantetheinyl transferase family protein [Lutibacter sp.]
MPLYKTIKIAPNTSIFVWKIEEDFDFLYRNISLTASSEERLLSMKSEIHRCGFLSIRHLLKEAGYTDTDLFYNTNGKPHLKDKKHISITHSFTFSAIIISDKAVGIDIEKNREKIKLIAHKFTNKEITSFDTKDVVSLLTIIWGAKESLYKIYPKGGITFKKHIPIKPFKISDGKTTGWIKIDDWNKKYDIAFRQLEDFTLVYALESIAHD